MLQNEWRALLSNLESVKEDYYNYSEQLSLDGPHVAVTMDELFHKMKILNVHSKQFHPNINQYSCIEHKNLYQHLNDNIS